MRGEEFKDDFRRGLAPELVRELTRRSAWRATGAVLADIAVLVIAIGVALAYWPNALVIIAAGVIIGSPPHAPFVLPPQAGPHPPFPRRRLNHPGGPAGPGPPGRSVCAPPPG